MEPDSGVTTTQRLKGAMMPATLQYTTRGMGMPLFAGDSAAGRTSKPGTAAQLRGLLHFLCRYREDGGPLPIATWHSALGGFCAM